MNKDSWKQLFQIKRKILEEILQDFENYEVEEKAKAIIEGKLQGIKNLQGEEK